MKKNRWKTSIIDRWRTDGGFTIIKPAKDKNEKGAYRLTKNKARGIPDSKK